MSWVNKLKNTFSSAVSKVSNVFSKGRTINAEDISDIETALIAADLGNKITGQILAKLQTIKFSKDASAQEDVKKEVISIMQEAIKIDFPNDINLVEGVNVILLCGVNGNGKTTTVGKLSHFFRLQGKKVVLAACDTFRAAAQEQLEHWALLNNVPIIKADKQGADPASVAYKAYMEARGQNADILIVDTAGRLNNNTNLMNELQKIKKVIAKIDPKAPHYNLLVVDATTGQNALNQARDFNKAINTLDGFIVTKVDSNAKAGAVISAVDELKIPIFFVGTGEKISEIEKFEAGRFLANIFT